MHFPPRSDVSRRQALQWLAAATTAPLVGGCTTAPVSAADDWHDVPLPGKRRTVYRWGRDADGRVLTAQADSSASMYRKHVSRPVEAVQDVEFAWWAQALPQGGDVATPGATDSAARVLFAFGGDLAKLTARDQLMFETVRALTGEAPPYATLAYVWDTTAPVGQLVVHPRSSRMRKIVVESGHDGLGQWRRYRRPLADDYRWAFGEPPGALLAVAVMTDGDNTGSRLLTRYRDIVWL